MPTKEVLEQLPILAVVAFAVRCARRVQPLYRLPAGQPDKETHELAVAHAVDVADRFAAGGGADAANAARAAADASADAANAARAAADASADAAVAAADPAGATDAYGAARATARAAEDAANAARAVATAAATADPGTVAAASLDAAAASLDAADNVEAAFFYSKLAEAAGNLNLCLHIDDDYQSVRGTTRAHTESAADDDCEKLLRFRLGEPRTLGQPVDPSESGPLGPLWPKGEPYWYVKAIAERTKVGR